MYTLLLFILVVLFVAYSVMGWTLYFMQPKFVYKPLRQVSYTPEELDIDFEDVIFETADGLQLAGWYMPAKESGYTVLFCHGNGGNIMHRLDTINIFYNLGINCFVFDYRGYGDSEGEPTEEGTYMDAYAAYKWLTENKRIPAEEIIIFGRSIGASIAAQLAGRVRAKALVLESAFTSYVDIGKTFYPYMPVRWFARFKYNTIGYVKNVHYPVMIIHSRDDNTVPFEFGMRLYHAANEPKEFVEISGSHNDGFLASGEIYKDVWINWLKFLKKFRPKTTRHCQQAS